ncbi:MAG: hypothetical protein JRI72_11780 [Deltaproteobacteria bacterium]|nr:hypothetical protein [Deltaproteobacteria bacterium]
MKKVFLSYAWLFYFGYWFSTIIWAETWINLDGTPALKEPTIEVTENNQNNVKLNLKIHGFLKTDTIIENETFHCVVLPQEFSEDSIGFPMVPQIKGLIQIPSSSGISVNYEIISDTILDNYYLIPYQQPSYRTDTVPIFLKNLDLYNSDLWYPNQIISVSNPAILADIRIVTLTVTPLQFNPREKKLKVYKDINVTINFSGTDTTNITPPMPIIRSDRLDLFYRDVILNYIPQVDTPISLGGPYWSDVNYYILAPDEYLQYLEQFIFWRNKCGYKVKVFKLSQIPGYNGQPADTVIIRNFIKTNCYIVGQNNTLLLIGDENDIPFYEEWLDPSSGVNYPSDHYYSLIHGTDEFPDISLGRLYVKSVADITTFINKIFWYERYRTGEPEWYPGDSWLFHGQDGIMENAKEMVWDIIGGPYCITELCNNPFLVSNQINNYGKGTINYFGHGLHDKWLQTTSNVFWTTEDIQTHLNNEHEYPLVVNMCCHNGAIQHSTPCMLEAWTLTPQKGAVAAIGATERCWGMGIPPNNLLCRMDTTLWRGFCANNYYFKWRHPFGLGLWKAKILMIEFGNLYAYTNARVYWLDGDPELTRWYDNYSILTVEHPAKLYKGKNQITVIVKKEIDNSPVYAAIVCFYKPNDVQEIVITDTEGQATATLNIKSTGILYVTARASRHWPYEGTLEVVNKNIDSPHNFEDNRIQTDKHYIKEIKVRGDYIEFIIVTAKYFSKINLLIYDIGGRFIYSRTASLQKPGIHNLRWSALDTKGRKLSPGTYFCILSDKEGLHYDSKKFIIP